MYSLQRSFGVIQFRKERDVHSCMLPKAEMLQAVVLKTQGRCMIQEHYKRQEEISKDKLQVKSSTHCPLMVEC